MQARQEFRSREETEVAILDALVNRATDGMTVFELRAAVETDIDNLERALAALKADNLITAEQTGSRTVIRPAPRVVPDESEPEETDSLLEWVRKRLPF